MMAYYNEHDPKAAAWLRHLIADGLVPPGDVDERDIRDILPADLAGYTQHHFFAGIGGWPYSLRLAGWPDDRPVWTGSCPCQPFSAAGKGGGFADERHLWPAQFHLIRERRPVVWLGEQVASKDGLAWLDLVQADLEGEGYAVGALDTCSAGFGAPHIRQRLRIAATRLADLHGDGRAQGRRGVAAPGDDGALGDGASRRLADAERRPSERHRHEVGAAPTGVQGAAREQWVRADPRDGVEVGGLALPDRRERFGLADGEGRLGDGGDQPGRLGTHPARSTPEAGAARGLEARERPGPTNGFWRDADWLYCRDGRWRPVEPGSFPLAHGAPARVGRLRGYGNAVDAEATRHFVETVIEELGLTRSAQRGE